MAYRTGASDRLLTADAFGKLPDEDDGYVYELVRGRLVREPMPKPQHGRVAVLLAARLHAVVERARLGVVLTNAGFVVETDPDTVRGPDLAFVAAQRVPARAYAGQYWRMGPDPAIEILSPSNSRREVQEKVTEYLRAGSRMVWVVDPRRRTVAVHRASREVRHLIIGDDIDGEDVVPGFRLPVAELFS